ncbi:MAG TPA: response regulator transcription factor, partial [Candidatus Baltobacteraceae bacterium]|nr:response regulator transcription factor [Candidatus Baltobacteraceae bacterium]
MKILLTDDHVVVRQGLKLILADHFKRAIFGEARNATEAIEKVSQNGWDVVILDINMPGRGGLETLKEIKRLKPKLPVLVLSMNPEDQFAVRMLKAGAAGYLTKESAGNELVGAIEKVVNGGRYISGSLAERMASYLDMDVQKPPHERLSDREFLILR